MSTPFDLLRARATRDPSAPYVTWYGPGGARAELSGITFATSVAKTAGMIVEELDGAPGDRIRLRLPVHWQLPVWAAAADLAGLTVVWDDGGAVDITVTSEPGESLADGVVVLSAATAFGRPDQPVPEPFLDHFTAAMGQPDVYLGTPTTGRWLAAGRTRTAGELTAAARELVGHVVAGAHVLIPPHTRLPDAALVSWLGPLLTGGSCVLVQAGDAQHIAAAEHAVFATVN